MTAIADIQRLVECESPTEDLAACNQIVNLAVEIAGQVLKTKAETISENGRPVFWWGSKQPKIVLLCHLDTVWPKGSFIPTWKVNGDIATGPGVFDMKAGFVQALYSLANIDNAKDKIALIATTDEETGMTGAFGLKAGALKGKILINTDIKTVRLSDEIVLKNANSQEERKEATAEVIFKIQIASSKKKIKEK